MKRTALALALGIALAMGPGCSDDSTSGTKKDGGGLLPDLGSGAEAGTDTGTTQKDIGSTTDQNTTTPDTGTTQASAMQLVVNTLTLPTSATTYAVDLDNNGTKDNQLGAILGALGGYIPKANSPQTMIDAQIKQGALILLFDILATSIVNAATMTLKMYLGADLDSNAADNFTGSEEFGISASSPTNLSMPGKITSGQMVAGPGTMTIPIPLGTTPTNVSLKLAQATGTLSSAGLAAGQINGAIPWTEVQSSLLPALATMLDDQYKNATDPTLKNLLKTLFDLNGDGTITATELKGNLILGIFLKADVDTDGDKKMDAMSAGLGFTGVTCKIKTN